MQEIVFRSNDNQALTTSVIVAEKFGKEHKHVLEAIRNILSTTAQKSAFVDNQQLAKMFALTEVEIPMPVGGGVKKVSVYVMNRDGFTLLAMIEAQQKQLEMQKPKVEFFEAVAESKTAIDIKAAANTLHFKNIGRNKLFEILRNAKILMWNNLPYQKYVDCGYFRTIEQKYTTHDGVKISIKTLVYQKGMDFIRKTLNNLGYKQVE